MKLEPSCLSALDELLHDIYVAVRPSSNNYDLRRELVSAFDVMARDVYGRRDDFPVVEAYGSFIMDMFSNRSDLDLSVNFSNDSAELPRYEKIKALQKFKTKLIQLQIKGRVSGVIPVLTAKVPILKVVDCQTGIECDISVENKDGILKSQFILIVSEIDERFQKLSSLMKAWAKANDINSSKDRTLNSLAIILFVAFHLQTREPPILPPFSLLLKDGIEPENVKKVVQEYLQYGKENKESVAELFATLLSKLASVEDHWREGLCASTYEGSWITKTWDSKVGSISVEDFMDRDQNVARAVGPEQAEVIFECINNSLLHLWDFAEGKIQGHELRELLFGDEQIPTIDEYRMSRKRRREMDLLSTLTPKKLAKRERRAVRRAQWKAERKMQVRMSKEKMGVIVREKEEKAVDSVVTEKEEKTVDFVDLPCRMTKVERWIARKTKLIAEKARDSVVTGRQEKVVNSVVTEKEEKAVDVVATEKEEKTVDSVMLPCRMTKREKRIVRKAKLNAEQARDSVVTGKQEKTVDSVVTEKEEKVEIMSRRKEKKIAWQKAKRAKIERDEVTNQRYLNPENPSSVTHELGHGSQFPRPNNGAGQVNPWGNEFSRTQTPNGGGHYWSSPQPSPVRMLPSPLPDGIRQWNSWGSPQPPVPQFSPPASVLPYGGGHQFWENAPPPVAMFPPPNGSGPSPAHMFPPPSHLLPPPLHISAQRWNSLPSQNHYPSQAAPFHPHPHSRYHPHSHRYL